MASANRAQPKSPRPDWFLLGIVLAILLAWLFPDAGAKGGRLKPELLNQFGVALIFFLHGSALSFSELARGTLRWRLHVLVQLSTFFLFPLLGVLAMRAGTWVQPELGLGLFFLCALPSTVSSSIALTAAARGNVPAAVFNATLSSVLGIFITPLWVSIVSDAAGQTLPLGPVILGLVVWLLLPLALGQLLRPVFGAFVTRHKSRLGILDRLTILCLVYTSFCDSFKAGIWSHGVLPVAVALAVSAALLCSVMLTMTGLGHALNFDRQDRIAALFCGSKKSLATGVPMARLMFGSHPGLAIILLPIIVYHSLQLIVGGVLAARFARNEAS